ncbi:IS3 family transposase [Halolactibacillus miurensis]
MGASLIPLIIEEYIHCYKHGQSNKKLAGLSPVEY